MPSPPSTPGTNTQGARGEPVKQKDKPSQTAQGAIDEVPGLLLNYFLIYFQNFATDYYCLGFHSAISSFFFCLFASYSYFSMRIADCSLCRGHIVPHSPISEFAALCLRRNFSIVGFFVVLFTASVFRHFELFIFVSFFFSGRISVRKHRNSEGRLSGSPFFCDPYGKFKPDLPKHIFFAVFFEPGPQFLTHRARKRGDSRFVAFFPSRTNPTHFATNSDPRS